MVVDGWWLVGGRLWMGGLVGWVGERVDGKVRAWVDGWVAGWVYCVRLESPPKLGSPQNR